MLEMLRDWAMVLSGVAVFGSLCEVILPEGSLQKYIRLGLGMLLVLALISPFQKFLQKDFAGMDGSGGIHAYWERENMEEKQKQEVLHFYRENLSQKMEQTLREEFPGFSGEVTCKVEEENPEKFGQILQIRVEADGNGTAEQIREVLCREYGVEKNQVEVPDGKEKQG